MQEIQEFFTQPTNLLGSTIIAALVSTVIGYLFRRSELRFKLETEYRYEEQKKLRSLVAKYQGRLLRSGNSLSQRMWNLYTNQDQGWLKVQGKATRENYYFLSFAYRFIDFCALLREFENEAIFIDSRIGTKADLQISNMVSALRWCLTDVALFKSLPYNDSVAHDHFYSDELRLICDKYLSAEDGISNFEEFCELAIKSGKPKAILNFFDGLSKDEDRLRWDRLVTFHLLIIGLVNLIGHSAHKTSHAKLKNVISQVNHQTILENLLAWLPRHKVPWLYVIRLRLAKLI